MTDQELKDLVGSLALSQKELSLSQKELALSQKETDRQLRKQLKELGQQIGGLGNKFGSFTEGLTIEAIKKLLRKGFGMTHVLVLDDVELEGKPIQIDALGYANGSLNLAIVVEIKSHLDDRAIEQLLKTVEAFPEMFPEHKDKKIVGLLAAVKIPKGMIKKASQAGLYLAHLHNEKATLQNSAGFEPKSFGRKTGT